MKFNRYISKEIRDMLEKQYNEYVKSVSMTKKEMRALREWVKDGNSVYENPSFFFTNITGPADFLTVYRNEEYVRKHTKSMSYEEAKRFAIDYYELEYIENGLEYVDCLIENAEQDDDLPF